MSDLFYEIENELNREKFLAFFYKHMLKLIIVVITLIIIAVIYPIYENKQNVHKAELVNEYYVSYEQRAQNKSEEYLKSLKKIYNHQQCAISEIAGLAIAQEYYKLGNITEGEKVLSNIVKNKCNKIISAFAEYLAINNSINLNGDNNKLLIRLEGLSEEVSVVNYRAKLLRATILVNNKAYSEAETILENILQSDFITENIKKDAQILLDNVVYYKLINLSK